MQEYSGARPRWQSAILVRGLRASRLLVPLCLALLGAACGGDSGTGPDTTPTPVPGTPVTGFVYYDENDDGVLDPAETVRLPGVTVAIGSRTGTSATGGRFTVDGVAAGAQPVTLRAETLPAYFVAGQPVTVTAPQSGGELAVPAALKIGTRNRPNVHLCFGDSITWGDGSTNEEGYREMFEADLKAYWGKADTINGGSPGTRSKYGEMTIGSMVSKHRPAYVLILYGTNDWNEPECRNEFPCFTIDALRSMVLQARDGGAMPVVGTIPPVNPAYTDRPYQERNDWVKRMNDLIRAMARQERAPIAEVHGDFLKQSSLPPLFNDYLHPNDTGYRVMSRSFFEAVTKPVSTASAARGFFFAPGGRP
jgi:lysophospholipase L1-like esterase